MSSLVPKVTRELKMMRRTMRDVFGLEQLRPGQAEVIRSVLEGSNTLAVMPTGAGKSLCYQLPALHIPGTTVIISPLISLMKDQVDKPCGFVSFEAMSDESWRRRRPPPRAYVEPVAARVASKAARVHVRRPYFR